MIVAEFNVNENKIKMTTRPYIVNWSNNYLQLQFTFNGEVWENLDKFILFHVKKKTYLFTLDSENSVVVPDYCMVGSRCIFTLYGENVETEVRVTCEQKHILLRDSNYTTDTDNAEEYSPDILVVLLDRVDTLEEEIHQIDGYSKSEIDGFLVLKSDVGHTHTSDDILDWDSEIISDFDIFCQDLADKINEI